MNDWKSALFITVGVAGGGAVILASQGISALWIIPFAAVVGIVLFVSVLWERRDNKKSFVEAEKFKAGYAFKDQREEQKYYAWAERHPPARSEESVLSDLILRYRAPRLITELLGVLALGLIEIILFKERAEGRDEPGVIYIVMGLMILLLYFALSNIFGFKARRFHSRLTERPDYLSIERSYTDGMLIGRAPSYINIGSEYIILITPKAVIPVKRSEITRVARANVLTAYYTNSIYSGSKESYFIKVHTNAVYSVQLNKFQMIQAYDLLKRAGLPADDTIDMR